MGLSRPVREIHENEASPYLPSIDDQTSLNQPDRVSYFSPEYSMECQRRTENRGFPMYVRLKGSMALMTSSNNKSSAAASVLTQTSIRNLLSDGTGDEQRNTNSCRSETHQIVLCPDSVYEVIWEDTMALEDRLSSSSSPPGISLKQPDSQGPSAASRHQDALISSKLISFLWEGERKDFSGPTDPKPSKSNTPARRYFQAKANPSNQGALEPQLTPGMLITPEADVNARNYDSSTHDINADKGNHARFDSSESELQHFHSIEFRKLSNLPIEAQHFASHRDSVATTHKRMHHNKLFHAALRA